MTGRSQRVVACLFAALGLALPGAARAAAGTFALALTEDQVDFPACRQFVGQAASADPACVRRSLGFYPAVSNWEERVWEVGGGSAGATPTVHELLVVFRAPVAVGTLALSPADTGADKGSVTGGELLWWKGGAAAPDPAAAGSWEQAVFQAPAQQLRFAVLPPGTRTRALLYRDVRTHGPARLLYLHAYRERLQDLTPAAVGACDPVEGAGDVDGIPAGKGWSIATKSGASDKTPLRYTLIWDRKQPLSGLFLYSNASRFSLQAFQGTGDPLAARPADWRPVDFAMDAECRHLFPHWEYAYRWVSFPALETAALRVEVTGVARGGKDLWVSGLAAMQTLGERPAVPLATRDREPPFRFRYQQPLPGDTALVIETRDGRRVRNLCAQTPRGAGDSAYAWDLKDEAGRLVAPGAYRLKGIVAPPLELAYGVTPAPNIQEFFPERVPWLIGHDGPQGWLSDHSPNWACASVGDRLYFGASMAEAGVCLIECDLDGRKQWGKHDFAPWIGVGELASDGQRLFILDTRGDLFALDPATRAIQKKLTLPSRANRRGHRSSMAAHDGRVYVAYTGEDVLDSAAPESALDLAQCLPKPPKDSRLAWALRLGGHPPGKDVDPRLGRAQGNGMLRIESTVNGARTDDGLGETTPVSLLAFKEPVPLGSLVFPNPAPPLQVRFSVLKPAAPYPPRVDEEGDWLALDAPGAPGWTCLTAPPACLTRAIRIRYQRTDHPKDAWFGSLDGLKLLRRRYGDARPAATVRTSSGQVDAVGLWDAARPDPVSPESPAVMVLQWDQPQTVAGLAFMEVEGAVTEVDVWQGDAGPAPLDGAALDRKSTAQGWRNVATYRQARRKQDYTWENNRFACYVDGYVGLEAPVATRAVRLRVTETWLDNGPGDDEGRRHDGRSEHGLHFKESFAFKLDPRACRIHGVAVLSPRGGEPPVDPLTYSRIEVFDADAGALAQELPSQVGWHSLAFGPGGDLFAIEKRHDKISRVDLRTGALTPVVTNAEPSTFTVGPDGCFYVRPWTDDGRAPLTVYDPAGRYLRAIGKPGGFQPGPWDPQRFGDVHRMCVDRKGSLWVLESQDSPRRIVQYKTDGTFVKEIVGNTHYGGGGTLNKYEPTRAYLGGVEFAIDWAKHSAHVRGLLGPEYRGGDLVAIRLRDRVYLATAPLSMDAHQAQGAVYLYDAAQGTVRLVAAMGDAGTFRPLRTSAVLRKMAGGVPREFTFCWSDRNGNRRVDADEVDLARKSNATWLSGVGRFDEALGCFGPGVRYEVTDVRADGTPVYARRETTGGASFRLDTGATLALHRPLPGGGEGTFNYATDAGGNVLWSYPAAGGVSGLSIAPWVPGLVGNQFGIVGHETAREGDLGEFVVIHDNTGQWRLWTADGLLAGNVLYHKMDGRAHLLGPPEARPGTRLDPLSASQEHFHGFFTRTEPDGKYYVIAGFTHMSLIEVKGLERFRRFAAEAEVTAADLAQAQQWEDERLKRRAARQLGAAHGRCFKRPPMLNGTVHPGEWPAPLRLAGQPDVGFSLGYDAKQLYLCWTGVGPQRNGGTEFQRLFKTGACLDFLLALDPQADPARRDPAPGDLRLLIAFTGKGPQVVLYQPRAPGAPAKDRWETFTQAAGKTAFDRVVLVPGAQVVQTGTQRVTVEAAIPLAALGVPSLAGRRLKMDWGVLSSEDGHQVKTRAYWANTLATGTADESVEARLEPSRWGSVEFEAGDDLDDLTAPGGGEGGLPRL